MKASSDGADLTCNSKLLQASGAAAEKARSPNFRRVLGRATFKLSADRKRIEEALLDTGMTRFDKYFGAKPCNDL